MDIVSLEGYKFNCRRCGNCCKVLNKTDINKKGIHFKYDYRGRLTKTPITSITLHYIEKKEIESRFENLSHIFIPYETFFLKNYPFEFTYTYQLRTKNGWCFFYNKEHRQCEIYSLRPSVCRSYPLYVDMLFLNSTPYHFIPNVTECLEVDSELKKRYPKIDNIMEVKFELETNYKLIFPNCYESYKNLEYRIYESKIFREVWGDLFIAPIDLIPNMVKNYKKLDFSLFWGWINDNKEELGKTKCLMKVREYKKRINHLKEKFNSIV